MLANWTKATTTTTGTGTITLTAVTGFPLPSKSQVTGEYVQYSIKTSDGKFESGIGTIGASETLARTRILATYDGTTYNQLSATALSLASGTHDVFICPLAENMFAAMPTIPPDSQVLHSTHMNTNGAANVGCTDRSRATCWPFRLESSVVITGFAVNVAGTAGGAGSITHVGLYEPLASNGNPGRRICTTTTAFDTSTTGAKTSTLSANVRVNPGWYWIAMVSSGGSATPTFSGNNGHCRHPFGGANGADSSLINCRINSGSDTTLPDPFYTGLTYFRGSNGGCPAIGLIVI